MSDMLLSNKFIPWLKVGIWVAYAFNNNNNENGLENNIAMQPDLFKLGFLES